MPYFVPTEQAAVGTAGDGSARAGRVTLEGSTDLFGGKLVPCMLHRGIAGRLGLHGGCSDVPLGTHPVVLSAQVNGERDECFREEKVRKRDAAFLAYVAGYEGLPVCRVDVSESEIAKWAKFATGGLLDVDAFGQGYCYLRSFHPGLRMRIARVVGPLPDLTTYLLLMRACGLVAPDPVVVEYIGAGLLHLRGVKPGDKRVFHTGNGICGEVRRLIEHGAVRVGSDSRGHVEDIGGVGMVSVAGLETGFEILDVKALEDQFKKKKKEMSLRVDGRDVEIAAHLFRVCVGGYANVTTRLVEAVVNRFEGVRVVKVHCPRCMCMVNPEGHVGRCRPVLGGSLRSVAQHEPWTNQRLTAWLNDVLLNFDAKIVAVVVGVEERVMDGFVAGCVQNSTLANYWRAMVDTSDLCRPTSDGEHALATAMECSYGAVVRRDYFAYMFALARGDPPNWDKSHKRLEQVGQLYSTLYPTSGFGTGGLQAVIRRWLPLHDILDMVVEVVVALRVTGEGGWTMKKFRSWLNVTVLQVDLRFAALLLDIPCAAMDSFVAQFAMRRALKEYMLSLPDRSVFPDTQGSSDEYWAEMFHGSYHGVFRAKYMAEVLSSEFAVPRE